MKKVRRSRVRQSRRSPRRRSGRVTNFIDGFRRLPLWKKVFVVAWPTVLVLLFIAVVTTISFAGALSSKEALMNRNRTGVTLTDRNGKPFYEFDNAHSDTYVTLDQIAPITQKALVSAEDKNFYKDPGFSVTGILDAIYQNVIHAGNGNGGSTITQQLVKNALLTNSRSLLRKYQELVLSVEITRKYSKEQILEMYFNSVYFGENAFGIQDAAQTYFGKDAKDLDLAQSAMLVGLLPAPSAYSPISGDANLAKERQTYVLGRMLADGVITKDQETAASGEQLSYQPAQSNSTPQAPHFALMVKDWLDNKYGEQQLARSGYTVQTTIDLDDQSKAQVAVQHQLNNLRYDKVSNGSAVIIDPKTGEVLALVGSVDWNNTDFGKVNMATAGRQPGSSFKPIMYATGIDNRLMTGATIFQDTPHNFDGYQPKDFDQRYRGDVTLRRALSNSLNIPAVEAIQQIGVQTVLNKARQDGLTTLTGTADQYGLPLALGSGQAELIQMTNAYATFANQGVHNGIQLVKSVADKNKNKIYSETANSSQVFSPGASFIISSILSDNTARAEEFGSSLTVSASRPVAVKTGTTEDYRDAWTIGYTPSLAIGVWVGNNDNSQMDEVAGVDGAAPIWLSLMRQLLTGTPVEKFTQPSTVVAHAVCSSNGALAQTAGTNTYTEYFLSGTLPTATCNEPEQQTTPQTPAAPTQPAVDTTPPSVPTGLTAAATSSTQVSLSWTASTDNTAVTGYKVYRNGVELTTTIGTTYTDSNLTPQTAYSYTVAAYDAAENTSQQSAPAQVTTPLAGGSGTPLPPVTPPTH